MPELIKIFQESQAEGTPFQTDFTRDLDEEDLNKNLLTGISKKIFVNKMSSIGPSYFERKGLSKYD